jgi:hypothetical protein
MLSPYNRRRLETCLGALVMVLACAPATAQIGVMHAAPGQPLADTTCINLQTNQPVPCPEKQQFEDAEFLVQRLYNESNFKELDALFDKWCAGKDRFPDGRWKLSSFGDAIYNNLSAWRNWDVDLKKIQKWRAQSPSSVAAWYAEAVFWRAYAWQARGTGYASSVSKEGWEIFGERLDKARKIVEDNIGNDPKCPAAYPLWLNLMLERSVPEKVERAVFDRAQRQFPEYHQIYFAMARRYEPKWGGSPVAYERFASEAAQLSKLFEGAGMYARIYWLVDYDGGLPFRSDPLVPPTWTKLKLAYEDLMKRYPGSLHNLGKYTGVVCRTTDSNLYKSLRPRLAGYENGLEFVDPVEICDRRHGYRRPGN